MSNPTRSQAIEAAAQDREAINFVTSDPAFLGKMTMTATFEEVSEVQVTLRSLGLIPVQRLKAREKAAGSEKPTR